MFFAGVIAMQPAGAQAGAMRPGDVRFDIVPHMQHLGGRDAEPFAGVVEDRGIGFADAEFAGGDAMREVPVDAERAEVPLPLLTAQTGRRAAMRASAAGASA